MSGDAGIFQSESLEARNSNIHFTAGGVTMLSITPTGFYVRGVKLEQDEAEARAVFEAFREWVGKMGHA